MSYSTVWGLWPGTTKRVELAEFRNSWGMAPVVWNAMAQRYMGVGPHMFFTVMDEMWPLHAREDIPIAHRAVLRMTFDTAYIAHEDRQRAGDDIALFLADFKRVIDPAGANHWPAFAALLIAQREDPPLVIGVHQTSVSENPWEGPYDEEKDEREPFDWSRAYSVYDGLPQPAATGVEP